MPCLPRPGPQIACIWFRSRPFGDKGDKKARTVRGRCGRTPKLLVPGTERMDNTEAVMFTGDKTFPESVASYIETTMSSGSKAFEDATQQNPPVARCNSRHRIRQNVVRVRRAQVQA